MHSGRAVKHLSITELTCTRCSLLSGAPALPVGTRSYDPRAVLTAAVAEDQRSVILVAHWRNCPSLDQAVRDLPERPKEDGL